eukprot:1175414-Prorocentrum_minimum.AAC.1
MAVWRPTAQLASGVMCWPRMKRIALCKVAKLWNAPSMTIFPTVFPDALVQGSIANCQQYSQRAEWIRRTQELVIMTDQSDAGCAVKHYYGGDDWRFSLFLGSTGGMGRRALYYECCKHVAAPKCLSSMLL